MSKRVLLTAGLTLAFAAFGFSQNQDATQGAASGHPQGTVVTERQTDTIVQPKKAPIKVTPAVVKDAQQKLNQAGYDSGPVDGVIGPKTRAALHKFQVEQKLQGTGELDQRTMAALNVGGVNEVASTPSDLGRGGKAIGHNAKGGHPVAAGKAAVTTGKTVGKKVGQGTESLAIKTKDKVGSGLSTIGRKVSGAGEKTKSAGEDTTENKQPQQ